MLQSDLLNVLIITIIIIIIILIIIINIIMYLCVANKSHGRIDILE